MIVYTFCWLCNQRADIDLSRLPSSPLGPFEAPGARPLATHSQHVDGRHEFTHRILIAIQPESVMDVHVATVPRGNE